MARSTLCLVAPRKKDPTRLVSRLTKDEQPRWTALVAAVRERAGYEVPEAQIIKALIGFRDLRPLHESDRELLRAPREEDTAAPIRAVGPGRPGARPPSPGRK